MTSYHNDEARMASHQQLMPPAASNLIEVINYQNPLSTISQILNNKASRKLIKAVDAAYIQDRMYSRSKNSTTNSQKLQTDTSNIAQSCKDKIDQLYRGVQYKVLINAQKTMSQDSQEAVNHSISKFSDENQKQDDFNLFNIYHLQTSDVNT